MNFAQIRSIAGQKDEQGYQLKLEMTGIVGNAPKVTFSPEGTKFQQILITDALAETQKVKIYTGEGTGLTASHIGQELSFNIGPNPYQGKMYYAGFWNSRAQPTLPQAKQAVQQPRQATNTPQPSRLDPQEATRLSIERQTSWRGACDSCPVVNADEETRIRIAQQGAYFISTGFSLADKKQADEQLLQATKDTGENPEHREPGEDDREDDRFGSIPY